MSFPNPRTSPEFFRTVIIGGRPVKATLVAVDGVEIEDEWAEQKPTGKSGATNVFKGTKAPSPVDLTFETSDRDEVEEWDDLRELYELLAPKAGSGGNGSGNTTGSKGSAAYGQQFVNVSTSSNPAPTATPQALLAQAQQALAAVQSGANVAAAAAGAAPAPASSATSAAAQPNPGPKPPTLSIVNGYLNYIGITAISRRKWKGPYITATNSHRVTITVIAQRDPTPAAVGASAPKTPDNPGQKSIPLGDIQGPAAAAVAANTAAAQAGAE